MHGCAIVSRAMQICRALQGCGMLTLAQHCIDRVITAVNGCAGLCMRSLQGCEGQCRSVQDCAALWSEAALHGCAHLNKDVILH